MTKGKNSGFKVLICDDDGASSRRFMDFLEEKGLETQYAANGVEAKDMARAWKPHFIIYDLTLEGLNATSYLVWLKAELKDYKPKVIVTSVHSIVSNIRECIRQGAVDYIVRPFKFEDVLTRIIFHIQNKREIAPEEKNDALEGGDVYLNLLDVAMREAMSKKPEDEIMFNIAKMVAITLKAVRCNIVNITEDRLTGTVMASSDDKTGTVKGYVLDMNKYPEMIHVMNTEKPVVIEDLNYDPQLAKIKDLVKGISFNSIIVCPIIKDGDMFGVISARMDKDHSKFNYRDIKFINLTAQILSLVLSRSSIMPHEFFAPSGGVPQGGLAEDTSIKVSADDAKEILGKATEAVKGVEVKPETPTDTDAPTKIIPKKVS